jgi:hypothetical protein
LLRRDLPYVNQILGQRLVFRKLADNPFAEKVGARITDLRNVSRTILDQRGCDRRPHSA